MKYITFLHNEFSIGVLHKWLHVNTVSKNQVLLELSKMALLAYPLMKESCLKNASDNRLQNMAILVGQDRSPALFLHTQIYNKIMLFKFTKKM